MRKYTQVSQIGHVLKSTFFDNTLILKVNFLVLLSEKGRITARYF